MHFFADLHVHSKYSRATAKDSDLENLSLWAQKKGISIVGTGDFTNPKWMDEIETNLVPAEPGLFRLRPELEVAIQNRVAHACKAITRFMLSVEISTIYKSGDKTRKVHHVVFVPSLQAAQKVIKQLSKIGNLVSDGRPILGLDSRDLLEIVLESDPASYLVPAHIWTPWFAVLGSKSGFDSIEECYRDLSKHIFALETGLSSDPPMNWRVSALDRYRLMSNSDAHSPKKLGREACVFDSQLDYYAIRGALETGQGYAGTVEFFPEEGKYHLDGHRNCGVRLDPADTRKINELCPECGKPLTVGVMHRVDVLSDRIQAKPPKTAGPVRSLVPLAEILSEIQKVGPNSKTVSKTYESLLNRLGPELFILDQLPISDIRRATSSLLAEAIERLRQGKVIRQAGYDGEYGVIRCFEQEELPDHKKTSLLFDLTDCEGTKPSNQKYQKPILETKSATLPRHDFYVTSRVKNQPMPNAEGVLAGLDDQQRQAAKHGEGALLIVAGPGTGKTRTLTHRIAYLILEHVVPAERCLALTFTRRAANELRQRLQQLVPDSGERVGVFTFHGLAFSILQDNAKRAGLDDGFRVASEQERLELLKEITSKSAVGAKRLLNDMSKLKRLPGYEDHPQWTADMDAFQKAMKSQNWVDYEDLGDLTLKLFRSAPDVLRHYQEAYPWVSIDEYQDIDEQQYQLVKLLVPPEGNLCVIGDPNQSIYGFRGTDVKYFQSFEEDFPGVQVIKLYQNYRSASNIVEASKQVIAESDSCATQLKAVLDSPQRIVIHEAKSDRAEAEFVVHTIEQVMDGHSFFSIDSGRAATLQDVDMSFSDIAVLYRMDAQAEALSEAFARSGMPFHCLSHARLIERPEIQAILENFLKESGNNIVERLKRAALNTGLVDTSVSNALESLLVLANDCDGNQEQFLSQLVLGAEIDSLDRESDKISLLSLHAAKGLEYRMVFIVGLDDGILPLHWGIKEDRVQTEEERRLFYVGITRAKDWLFLCRADKRKIKGKLRQMKRSEFLNDIQEQLLEHRQMKNRKKSSKKGIQLGLFSSG
jgi:DNA helicase-2/ATP-dependent DNA helicase PcrA